ncbi:chorismate-binding protein [Microvirga sp. VF16]|uniref:chorismate-binding protein n=1 Tax=Microvirga sp. VF16 TaxID=2807101 RepID=UPI00193E55D9|nr:chorismate-binding protein [Microvirga sp. VF16]QRM33174.1 anthranilate synthase component I family protein [Microvirga sp. VF16]
MPSRPFNRVIERFTLDQNTVEMLSAHACAVSKFSLQRSAGGGAPPDFTYFGLEVTPITQEQASDYTDGTFDGGAESDPDFRKVPFQGGVFTYLPYDATAGSREDAKAVFWLVTKLLIIDHTKAQAFIVSIQANETEFDSGGTQRSCKNLVDEIIRSPAPLPSAVDGTSRKAIDWEVDTSIDEYQGKIREIQTRIARDELHQAILSVGLSKTTSATADAVFNVMRRRNSSPHIFLVRSDDITLIGASPAMHLRKSGRLLTVETDAGTRRLGETEDETQAIMNELLNAEKDLEEQKMIVDETIADLKAIAADAKVEMPVELEVRKLGSVMHLYTVLEAQIKEGLSPIEAVLSCFPPSAVTGAPRHQAMKVIQQVEGTPRGPYGGVLGLIGFDGSVDTAIILRSAWVKGDRITMRCGGGITHASDAMDEYNECMNKAQSMIDCVREAEAF